jgi:aryl-alcohol dehydrogenase-like predicted oxidoreductase
MEIGCHNITELPGDIATGKEKRMEYRPMGKTGLQVSELCLGAMTFGRESDKATSFNMLDRFVADGGNFIDTADVYSHGVSETVLGRWLKNKPRDKFIIATKVRFAMGDAPNDVGLSRKHILDSIDGSLKRLGVDYVDLYQVHCWDQRAPLEETLSALDRLVQSGKVRYIGVSNFTGWQLQKALDISAQMGWEPFTCLQPQYNLLCRTIEWEVLPVCLNEGLAVIPWSPLRGGWLSGKYHRGMTAPIPNTRIDDAEKNGWSEAWSAYNRESTWKVLDALFEVAEMEGRSPVQVALNWVLNRPGVTAPIIGVRNMAQLDSNLGATGWSLSEEALGCLNQASEPELPYPYDFVARNNR